MRIQNSRQIRAEFRLFYEQNSNKYDLDKFCTYLFGNGTIEGFVFRMRILKPDNQASKIILPAFNSTDDKLEFSNFKQVWNNFINEGGASYAY